MTTAKYAKITGTGGYLPTQVFSNADWEKRVDTSDAWIISRTGIHSRHVAQAHETASYMGSQAAQAALDWADYPAASVEMIIVATATPDKIFPATACLIQKKLGIPECIAFDIQAACTGFVYALSIADQYIRSGTVKSALVIGSELMTRTVDWSDRSTCVLFGDGAGAVLLQASESPGVLSTDLYAQGAYDEVLYIDNAFAEEGSHSKHFLKMEGQKLFKIAVTKLAEMIPVILAKHNLTADQIDWLIPHQANLRIIRSTADKLGFSMDKVVCTVATHSNTSSASIPLALDVAVRDGRIKPGQILLFEAIGGGLTWGSALVKF